MKKIHFKYAAASLLICTLIPSVFAVANVPETESDRKPREMRWVEQSQQALQKKLENAHSAKFQGVYFSPGIEHDFMVCGYVNSKNASGEYTGFQRFMSNALPEQTFLETQTKDFHAIWNHYCLIP